MDNQPQPSNQMPKATAWAVIIVIILVLGVGGYFLLKNGNSNTNSINTTANTNTALNVNANTNAVSNSNLLNNTNTASNTNTTLDTSGWKTYTNSEYGYTMKYPSDWTVEEQSLSKDPLDYLPVPIRGVYFYSPEKKYQLIVGIMKNDDKGSIIMSTGIGGTDTIKDSTIKISNKNVEVTKVLESTRVTSLIIPVDGGATRGAIVIQDYDFKAEFLHGTGMTLAESQKLDIQGSNEEKIIYHILETLNLP